MTRLEKHIAADIRHYLQACYHYEPIRCVSGPVRSTRIDQTAAEPGNPAGYPDWLFIRPDRRQQPVGGTVLPGKLYIEVKRPGNGPTIIQRLQLARLRKDGFVADWFDGFRASEGRKPFLVWWEELTK